MASFDWYGLRIAYDYLTREDSSWNPFDVTMRSFTTTVRSYFKRILGRRPSGPKKGAGSGLAH